ncbi:alpha/beta fold hydrolase [Terrimonas alba]|uniref:alpha/beta fold hydrolase n=1 Tax=Terrimonas alba TaxID=3349636 RepID=UPI0035F4F867
MKNRVVHFLLLLMCGISTTTMAQSSFHRMGASSNAVVVKTIKLSTGVTLEYAEQGDPDGEPVIFLHGITDSWHSFESTFKHLPASIHAFAVSQRGHGDSERPADGYTPKDFAADIADFIKQNKLGPVIIAGHSMGGVNAQQFALDYPQLTKGLVIIDSDPAMKENPGMPEFYHQVMQLKDPVIDKQFMDEFQKSTLVKPIDPAYYELLVEEGLKVPTRVFKAALTGLINVDYTKDLEKITVPALIFWGDKDAFCLEKDQQVFIDNIRNAKLITYENTGHALHWEEPVRFATDLVNFINKFF